MREQLTVSRFVGSPTHFLAFENSSQLTIFIINPFTPALIGVTPVKVRVADPKIWTFWQV